MKKMENINSNRITKTKFKIKDKVLDLDENRLKML